MNSLDLFIGYDVVLERLVPKLRKVTGEIIHETPTLLTIFYLRRGLETTEILPLSQIRDARVTDQEWGVGATVEVTTVDQKVKKIRCRLVSHDGTYLNIRHRRGSTIIKEVIPVSTVSSISMPVPEEP